MPEYAFKTKPFAHQMDALSGSWSEKYHALFMEMGTGKSKVIVDTIGKLYEAGEVNAALVVAPKGVYDNWIKKEIPQHLPDGIPRKMVRWIPAKTKRFEEELYDLVMNPFDGLKIFVVNIEAFSSGRGAEAAYVF